MWWWTCMHWDIQGWLIELIKSYVWLLMKPDNWRISRLFWIQSFVGKMSSSTCFIQSVDFFICLFSIIFARFKTYLFHTSCLFSCFATLILSVFSTDYYQKLVSFCNSPWLFTIYVHYKSFTLQHSTPAPRFPTLNLNLHADSVE